MPVSAGITAAAGLFGAGINAYSANKAADTQADALKQTAAVQQNALDFQKQVYSTNQGYLSPYINNGNNAMYSLASLYGLPTPNNPNGGGTNAAWDAFTKLPAYQFPLQQGSLALERQLNAQGRTQSGAQARETQQFGQGLASTYLMSNYVNPLMSMMGSGVTAAGALSGANNNTGSNIQSGSNALGQTYGNIGTAQASGIMGMGNSLSSGLNNAGNSLAVYSMLANGNSLSPTYSLSSGSSIPGSMGPTSVNGGPLNGYSGTAPILNPFPTVG